MTVTRSYRSTRVEYAMGMVVLSCKYNRWTSTSTSSGAGVSRPLDNASRKKMLSPPEREEIRGLNKSK